VKPPHPVVTRLGVRRPATTHAQIEAVGRKLLDGDRYASWYREWSTDTGPFYDTDDLDYALLRSVVPGVEMVTEHIEYLTAQVQTHCRPEEGLVIEVGAWAGLPSLALAEAGYDVLVTDPQPKTEALVRAAADRIGGVKIRAAAASLADLPALVGDRPVAAVIASRSLLDAVPHKHDRNPQTHGGRPVMGTLDQVRNWQPPVPDSLVSVLQALRPRVVAGAEIACLDRVLEYAAAGEAAGLHLADLSLLTAPFNGMGGDRPAFALNAEPHDRQTAVETPRNGLSEPHAGVRATHLRADLHRLALGGPDKVERLGELRISEEQLTIRFEVASKGSLGWLYSVNSAGASEIIVTTTRQLPRLAAEQQAQLEGERILPVDEPAHRWPGLAS
jgi:hypothetical protein